MKTLISTILMLISYLGAAACFVWAIVSFIIYLVKDEPFDWRSIWWLIALSISTLFFLFYSAIVGARTKKNDFIPMGKSKFQQRLDEMKKKREGL